LPLITLFRRDCDYRETLGLLCREALKRQAWERSLANTESAEFWTQIFAEGEFSREWLIRGTNFEDDENVKFTLTDNGVTFYFAPYQIACFAAGSWEVTLPYYDLREILHPGVLRQLLIPTSSTR
jgi:hypothetical protein